MTVTAFDRSPDGGKGLARDRRLRWAPEDVCLPHKVRLVTFGTVKQAAHLALQPFGQIPTFEDGDLALFKSWAIVLHIAQHHPGLLPVDADARAGAISWIFAALSTMEPPILELVTARPFEADMPWAALRMMLVADRLGHRLGQLSRRLGNAPWRDGALSAGDLMRVSVLLRVKSSGLLDAYATLSAHVARGEARPACQRAFAAQLAVNHPPAS